jgi:hypothetical protein
MEGFGLTVDEWVIREVVVAEGLLLDPVVVIPVLGLTAEAWGEMLGERVVAIHACVGCDPGKMFVLERVGVTDPDGCCLVCGDLVMERPQLGLGLADA